MKQIDGMQNNKKIAVCAGILFVLSLLPIIILGRYNVMCIDDYNYGCRIHDVWMATGSFTESVQAAWQQCMEIYQTWQGTYASVFLFGLCPMNFHYESAWIVPILMVCMFSISTFVLGRQVFIRWLGINKADAYFVLFILLFMYYQLIEAPFEGIYWYNGASHYVLMQSVCFFSLTFISAGFWCESKPKEFIYCIIAMILAIITGGGNLITCLQAEIVMAFLVLYALIMNRKKIMTVLLPFVTGSIGFFFNVSAPGNWGRKEAMINESGYSAVVSVLLSFYHAVCSMVRWTPAVLVIMWLALLPVLWKIVKKSDKSFKYPLWVTVGAYCVLSAMFTPTLYVYAATGFSRIDNIIQMVYYLCLIMVTAYWLGYLSHRNSDGNNNADNNSNETFDILIEKSGLRITAACFLLVCVIFVFTGDKNTYTSISALRSLLNGDARTFYAEAMERYGLYTDDSVADVEIKPYSARPELFNFEDLSEDEDNWLNLAVTQYYHKDSVKIIN